MNQLETEDPQPTLVLQKLVGSRCVQPENRRTIRMRSERCKTIKPKCVTSKPLDKLDEEAMKQDNQAKKYQVAWPESEKIISRESDAIILVKLHPESGDQTRFQRSPKRVSLETCEKTQVTSNRLSLPAHLKERDSGRDATS